MYKERVSSVADRLKEAMRLKDKRQTDLCTLCKIPKGAMSLYLQGTYQPKQDRLEKLANALNVDVTWLMGYDVPMEQEKKPDIKYDKRTTEFINLFTKLSPEQQDFVILQIKGVLSNK